jgi:hypothetical protein
MEILSLIVAVLALLSTIVLSLWQLNLQRRVSTIEEARRAEEVESRLSADVTAELQNVSLVLVNRGPAIAEDIGIERASPNVQISPEGLAPINVRLVPRSRRLAGWLRTTLRERQSQSLPPRSASRRPALPCPVRP